MDITNRYGVQLKGELITWGTNDPKEAKSKAKAWGGVVVDLAALGKKFEDVGINVNYTYRKND